MKRSSVGMQCNMELWLIKSECDFPNQDVMIIAITLIDTSKQVLVDYRNDKNRKGVWLYSIALNDNIRAALIGSHAFTGNDYASSFFKRGKYGYFKVMKQ